RIRKSFDAAASRGNGESTDTTRRRRQGTVRSPRRGPAELATRTRAVEHRPVLRASDHDPVRLPAQAGRVGGRQPNTQLLGAGVAPQRDVRTDAHTLAGSEQHAEVEGRREVVAALERYR